MSALGTSAAPGRAGADPGAEGALVAPSCVDMATRVDTSCYRVRRGGRAPVWLRSRWVGLGALTLTTFAASAALTHLTTRAKAPSPVHAPAAREAGGAQDAGASPPPASLITPEEAAALLVAGNTVDAERAYRGLLALEPGSAVYETIARVLARKNHEQGGTR